mmetsp:Transcript_17032/g.36956  ORF Transcript_17032/g.36956 Transcript_17032/m.36956 type:complete len:98 (+) Transcript_17032:52-345(+)
MFLTKLALTLVKIKAAVYLLHAALSPSQTSMPPLHPILSQTQLQQYHLCSQPYVPIQTVHKSSLPPSEYNHAQKYEAPPSSRQHRKAYESNQHQSVE